DDLGGTVGPFRLEPRRRIRIRLLALIQTIAIPCAVRRRSHAAEVPVVLGGQRRDGTAIDHHVDSTRGRRPHSEMSPAVAERLSAKRKAPPDGRYRYRGRVGKC